MEIFKNNGRTGWPEKVISVILYFSVFLLFVPSFGSQILPLFDYPIYHNDFTSLAEGPFLRAWNHVNEMEGMRGRFIPLFFAMHGIALRLNSLPQICYWILVMMAAMADTYLICYLARRVGNSSRIGLIAGYFFLFTPYTLSTSWLTINQEPFQIFCVLASMASCLLFICDRRSYAYFFMGIFFYGMSLGMKESSILLLPAILIWLGMRVGVGKVVIWRPLLIAIGTSACSLGWYVLQWRYIILADKSHYGGGLLDGGLLAASKRFLIYINEVSVVMPAVLIVIGCGIWIFVLRLIKRRSANPIKVDLLGAPGLFMASIISWIAGMSFIRQIEIRYIVPMIALGIIIGIGSVGAMNRKLRIITVSILAIAMLNNLAGTLTARRIQINWSHFEESIVRNIAELPKGSILICASRFPSSGSRLARRIRWSTEKWFLRGDVRAEATNGYLEGPEGKYLLLIEEKGVSEWLEIGWHQGGDPSGEVPKEFNFKSGSAERSGGFAFWGWQVRGWHLLVCLERLFKRDGRPWPPIGLTLYEAHWDLYKGEKADLHYEQHIRP